MVPSPATAAIQAGQRGPMLLRLPQGRRHHLGRAAGNGGGFPDNRL